MRYLSLTHRKLASRNLSPRSFPYGLFCLIFCIFIFTGCAKTRPETDPALDKKALVMATEARGFNSQFASSRGTGWARLETKGRVDRFRIAWVAVHPGKIRITFLISGNPVETIISTGEKITLFSHTGEHSKHSYKSKDPDMEDYVKVPVKMSEMIAILLGHLPVKEFEDAYFSPHDPTLSTVILGKKRQSFLQQIHFNSENQVDILTSTDSSGRPLYDVTIKEYKTYDFGVIPATIQIKDIHGRTLVVNITSFQPNPTIKESVFQLTEQG
jgi:outer membrane lipoprotein-sorting protein